ncbi:MAG TPA: hypothetical protein VLV76_26040 [Candidatus Acidoferrum sp.]|nr:hypothetical protein [Candidatus Acidoferrum sp.]
MTAQPRYSSCDYLAAMGLAATLAMQAPFLCTLPLWILALLQREASER